VVIEQALVALGKPALVLALVAEPAHHVRAQRHLPCMATSEASNHDLMSEDEMRVRACVIRRRRTCWSCCARTSEVETVSLDILCILRLCVFVFRLAWSSVYASATFACAGGLARSVNVGREGRTYKLAT
jgi:hypothetical protein